MDDAIANFVERKVEVIVVESTVAALATKRATSTIPKVWRRSAQYVDRILKGDRPGDLPIQQPTTFDLVVNLKAAKTLGVTVSPSVLDRADRVVR